MTDNIKKRKAEFLAEYEALVWKHGVFVSGHSPTFPFLDAPLFSARHFHLKNLKEQLAKEKE